VRLTRPRFADPLAVLLAFAACGGDAPTEPSLPPECVRPSALTVEEMAGCLHGAGRVSASDLEVALGEIGAARAAADSLQATGIYEDLLRGRFVVRALQHVADLYDEGAVGDSARMHRLLDHVMVSADFVRGNLVQAADGYWITQRTPEIAWVYLPNVGIYPDPAGSVHRVLGAGPVHARPELAALESLGEALWAYGVPMSGDADAPIWELYYPAISCTVFLLPPRQSAAVQTAVLRVFTELARRTGNERWAARAAAVMPSFRTSWDDGGVRVAGRDGAWWEEADPRAGYWRGAARAAVAVWDFAEVTGNSDARELAEEGVRAAKLAAPRFDDGTWTRDCLGGGYQDRDNHQLFIRLADALHSRTGDHFWADLATRWAALVPPPGFAVAGSPR
jgi:hypothetical protein